MKKMNEKREDIMLETEEMCGIMEGNTAKKENNDDEDDFLELLDSFINSQRKMADDEPDYASEEEDEEDYQNDYGEEHDEDNDDSESYDDSREKDLLEEEVRQSTKNFEASLAFLDDMVGMEHVKQKLQRLGYYAQWRKKMEIDGIDTSSFPEPNLTFMFLGSPGTGKTTVAMQMGKILQSIGLIAHNSVYEYRREDLVGQNYGAEEQNTREALNKSAGGVFFLDEAYQCFKQGVDKRDPGYHILETMMQDFDKPGRCIIMAGYKEEMIELFKVNPGFRSRIPDENIIEFTGPSEQMLIDVATNTFRKMSLHITADADATLRQHIHEMWVNKDNDFGNARVIRQLAESVVINHANRIMTTTQCDDFTISDSDIRQSMVQPQRKSPTRARIGFV